CRSSPAAPRACSCCWPAWACCSTWRTGGRRTCGPFRKDHGVSQPRRILIAAGGTAGHVVPALAVADALRAEGAAVDFVGGERAERTLVPEAGFALHAIAVEGLSRSNPLRAARAAARAAAAVRAAGRILV